jgi:tetratricopeptide (TPR) repeat protein
MTNPPVSAALAHAAQQAWARAGRGELPIAELFQLAQELDDAGQLPAAVALYRQWLAHGASPLAYAARFNLAVLHSRQGDAAAAEAGYRAALQDNPRFAQAWVNLATLLEHAERGDEALTCWQAMLDGLQPDADADRPFCLQALNQMGRMREQRQEWQAAEQAFARSLALDPGQGAVQAHLQRVREQLANTRRDPAAIALSKSPYTLHSAAPRSADPDHAEFPLVSILIPTHNRPDYGELALQSALAQTWPNIEIIISDNSDDELTRERFAPYVARHPCIRYLRLPGTDALANGLNCYDNARGAFFNFLMDDDLLHPDKVARMMHYMRTRPDVGIITSFRQLIDAAGAPIEPPPEMRRRYDQDSLLPGDVLGAMLLSEGNIVGEPTTVLVRRAAMPPTFGHYRGHQYITMSDMATWLSILSDYNAVYMTDALSYFRIHGGQDQRMTKTQVRGHFEGLQMLCDAFEHGRFLAPGEARDALLANKVSQSVLVATARRELIRDGAYPLDEIVGLITRGTALLMAQH